MTMSKKLLYMAIVLAAFFLGYLMPRPYIRAIDGTDDVVPFDHSNCQYPDRWSNPKDGCDNSDPAVPECIKAAYTQASEQACIDAFVKAHQTPEQTTTPVEATPPQSTGSTCK